METRRAKRFKASFKVKLKVDTYLTEYFRFQKESIEVEVLDIGFLGVGILSRYFIPRGAIVDLQFNIDNKTFDVKCQIKSAISGGKGLTRMGIKFLDLDKSELEKIKKIIENNERRKQPRLELT